MKLFVDNLTVIDCSLLHPRYGVSGQSWIVDVALQGDLDDQSMVMDFGLVKKKIKCAIDAWVDHKLLVPLKSDCLVDYQPDEQATKLEWQDERGDGLRYQSPAVALCALDVVVIDAAAVRDYLEQRLMAVVNVGVQWVEITLREEVMDTPFYHYSHGLKKHDGCCQRMVHGHRSKLEIWRDGELARDWMAHWCDRWSHIYVGSQEDVAERVERDGVAMIRYAYTAPEGAFELEMAESRCEVIPTDSTVECIADYILSYFKQLNPDAHIVVKAYEGVGKGAQVGR